MENETLMTILVMLVGLGVFWFMIMETVNVVEIDQEDVFSCVGDFSIDDTFFHPCEHAVDEDDSTYAIIKQGVGVGTVHIFEETLIPENTVSVNWSVKLFHHPFGGGISFYYYNYASDSYVLLSNDGEGSDGVRNYNLQIPTDGFFGEPRIKILWNYTGNTGSGVNGYFEGKALVSVKERRIDGLLK